MRMERVASESLKSLDTIVEFVEGARSVAIAGHEHPDGDCVGACMAAYLYLRANCPDLTVDVYLEEVRDTFRFLEGADQVKTTCDPTRVYDVMFLMDISSTDRIGVAGPLFATAKKKICFDHHATNNGTFDWLFNYADSSSTCEVLCNYLDAQKVTKPIAEALFLGVTHDTGIFRYRSTSPKTHQLAANLMQRGIDANKIIEDTYFVRSVAHQRILGRVLQEAQLLMDDRVIIGMVTKDIMDSFGAGPDDMEDCVTQLRNTAGVQIAVFMYEVEPGKQKVSLRSREVDISKAAQALGGGGHARAAGATVAGAPYDVLGLLAPLLEEALATEK